MRFRFLAGVFNGNYAPVGAIVSDEPHLRNVDFAVDAILFVGRYTSILRNNMAALRNFFTEPVSERR